MKKEKFEKLLKDCNCKQFTKDNEEYVCFTKEDFALLIRHLELAPTDSNELNIFCFRISSLKTVFENEETLKNYFADLESKDLEKANFPLDSLIKTLQFTLDNIKMIELNEELESRVIKLTKKAMKNIKKKLKEKS